MSVNVEAREAFYVVPDVNDLSRTIAVKDSNWIAQVFLAKSDLLPRIYFLAKSVDELEIEIYEAEETVGDSGEQIFQQGSSITSSALTASDFNETEGSQSGAKWYFIDCNYVLETGLYYMIVFKSNVSTGNPFIYYSLDYRSSVFPTGMGYDQENDEWSNDLFTGELSGDINRGAVCFGFIGNELSTSVGIDSGTVAIGGGSQSIGRRGYPTYIHVENTSTGSSVDVDFFQIPPDSAINGSSDETDQSMMRWYYYDEKTLPLNTTTTLNRSTGNPANISFGGFVVYTQPDRLSPNELPYFPETEIEMQSNELGVTPLYEVYESGYGILFGSGLGLTDSTDRYSDDYWAHFSRAAGSTTNPSYLDFSTERPGPDIENLTNLTDLHTDIDTIRGYDNIVYYRGYYIAFPKYITYSAIVPDLVDHKYMKCYSASEDNLSVWSKITITIDIPSTLTSGANTDYIFGVNDTHVEDTSEGETLFFAIKVYSDPMAANTNIAKTFPVFTFDDPSSNMTGYLLALSDPKDEDGKTISPSATADDVYRSSDIKSSMFIRPDSGDNLYFLARNIVDGMGVWTIDMSQDFATLAANAARTALTRQKLNIQATGSSDEDGRGIGYLDESFVSYVLKDGPYFYLGIELISSTNENTRVYRTLDFQKFDSIVSRDANWYDGFTQTQYNQTVPFMCKVGNILHIWMSPLSPQNDGTPFHIAADLDYNKIMILRKFPIINEAGDTDYSAAPTISDLNNFPRSKSIRHITGGSINGNYIYICGYDKYAYDGATDTFPADGAGIRCLAYDDRIINSAVKYYRDSSYSFTLNGQTVTPFAPISVSGENRGTYNGTSVEKYELSELEDYPGIADLSSTQRIGIYCGLVNYADIGGTNEYGGFYKDNRMVFPRMVSQRGISYLIIDNDSSGIHIFKIYGMKQLPENWGDNTNTDFDYPIAHACHPIGAYEGEIMASDVSVSNGIIFISSLRLDLTSSGNNNDMDTNVDYRPILAISNTMKRPQSISFYYHLDTSSSISESNANILSGTSGTNTTVLNLKSANTLEDLFFNNMENKITLYQTTKASTSPDPSLKSLYKYVYSTDENLNFFRLEPNNLLGAAATGISSTVESIKVKGLKLSDVDMDAPSSTSNWNILANGIVRGRTSSSIGYTKISEISEFLQGSIGACVSSGSEIIISFIKPIYVSDVFFEVSSIGTTSSGQNTLFKFYYVPTFEKHLFDENVYSDNDWSFIGEEMYDGSSDGFTEIRRERIGLHTSTIKIYIDTNTILRMRNLKVSTFDAVGNVTSNGNVTNKDLILMDDILGIVNADSSSYGSSSKSYASLNRDNSSITIDLGVSGTPPGAPITRITMNTFGTKMATKTISVDILSGEIGASWENVYTGPPTQYGFGLCSWSAGTKNESRTITLEAPYTAGSTNADYTSLPASLQNYATTSWSTLSSGGSLIGMSFRPNYNRDRSLSIVDSKSSGTRNIITVNAQMDGDGPFADDQNETGMVEKNVNIHFPLRQIAQVRVKLINASGTPLHINGFKVHTPLMDSDGNAVWPKAGVEWTIRLNVTSSGS